MLDVVAEDGRTLDRIVVTPDWKPAREWVHFEGVREGRLPPVTASVPAAIEPIWDARSGPPTVAAFRARIPAADGGEVSREIPKHYLGRFVQAAVGRLVEEGVVRTGDTVRYVLSAFPVPLEAAAPAEPDEFAVEEIVQPLPLSDAPLDALLAHAELRGAESEERTDEIPVLLPEQVLEETMADARLAGDIETGGVLVGKLRRDGGAPAGTVGRLFVEITAYLPAPHTRANATKLTFTAETWAAVQRAIALRRREETAVGWAHVHLDFCRLRGCPAERRMECSGARPFFSAEDVHLHTTCFPSAYQVGLLISESTAAGLTASLFGWSRGMVTQRSFHVLRAQPEGALADVTHAGS